MTEYAKSRMLDGPLQAAIAKLHRNAADSRVAASKRVCGESELVPSRARKEVSIEKSEHLNGGAGVSANRLAPAPFREGVDHD